MVACGDSRSQPRRTEAVYSAEANRARVASGGSSGIRRLTTPERSLSDCHGANTSAPALRPDSSTAAERSSTASEIMSIPARSSTSNAASDPGSGREGRCAHLITEGGSVDRLWARGVRKSNGSATPSQPLSVGSSRSIARLVTAITATPMPARSHFCPPATTTSAGSRAKGTLRIPGWRPPRAGHHQRVPASPRGRPGSRSDSRPN